MDELDAPPELQSLNETRLEEKRKEAVASSGDQELEDMIARAGVQGTGARSDQ